MVSSPCARRCLHSYNAASVSLIEFTGIDLAREYALRMGLPLSDSDNYLSLALGSLTYGVTPAELTAAYAALSNGRPRRSGAHRRENSRSKRPHGL